jgi:hypothetical protein
MEAGMATPTLTPQERYRLHALRVVVARFDHARRERTTLERALPGLADTQKARALGRYYETCKAEQDRLLDLRGPGRPLR